MSNDLEDSLRAALRPVDPGERFTQQVMSRIASESSRSATGASPRALAFRRSLMAIAASIVLALLIAHEWQLRRTQQGLEARRQVLEALRVTGQKLDLAYRAVNDSQRRADKSSGA
jgi:hypothetical protein